MFYICRPTFVHRFIVRNTLEERMYDLLQSGPDSSADDMMIQFTANSHRAQTNFTIGKYVFTEMKQVKSYQVPTDLC